MSGALPPDAAALRCAVEALYARYANALNQERFDAWLDLFVEDCTYKVTARENHARGLPLGVMAYESRGMLRDRVYGVQNTLYHQPYYQRHCISNFVIETVGDTLHIQANYSIIRTKRIGLSEVFNVGRYVDTLVWQEGALRIKDKLCIYDSELIPTSLIYPI